MITTGRRRAPLAAVVGLAALLAGPLLLQGGCRDGADAEGASASSAGGTRGATGPGRILYLTHCESCHGVDGRGDGRAAEWLRTPPTDLTRLFERYGTPLDRERVAEYIDGRMLVDVHGPREMPVWGEEFFEDVPGSTPGLEAVKRRLVEVLVAYLETLQAERLL